MQQNKQTENKKRKFVFRRNNLQSMTIIIFYDLPWLLYG